MEKKVKLYVVKIVTTILVLSFCLDKVVFYSLNLISDRVKTGSGIGKLNHYLSIKEDLDFIVFGSSRANHHINPSRIVPKSFNMGIDGSELAYAVSLIKLLPKSKKQTIFLHIGASNAYSAGYDGSDIKALLTKYHRIESIKEDIDELEKDDILQKFYWSIGYNGLLLAIIKNFVAPKYDFKEYNGYDPISVDKKQQKIFSRILKAKREVSCENTHSINPIYAKYLREVQDFCNANNKNLILFTSPLHLDYCEEDNIALKEYLKLNKATYYDFSNFFGTDNKLKYWKDNSHLSKEGAELFTNKIKLIHDNFEN